MPEFDLSRLTVSIWINSEPAAVCQSWLRAGELSKWFQHRATNFARAGDCDRRLMDDADATAGTHYEWRMSHGHISRGEYLAVDPPRSIRMTFGSDGAMHFTVTFEPLEAGTFVRLTHENIPPADLEAHVDIKAGWTFFLANLKAWHEHGVDLREHDAKRIRMGVANI